MTIKHRASDQQGEFYLEEQGDQQALLVYRMQGNTTMVIEHTEVEEALQGKNVGQQLVEAAVNYARSHHQKIVPVCSFARSVFNKTPGWHDVLA